MITYNQLDAYERDCRIRFGNIVKQYRGEMSLERLGGLCNLNPATIKSIEEGKNCRHSAVLRICKILDIPYFAG